MRKNKKTTVKYALREKDSLLQNNTSKWSVTPQAIISYYGSLSTKSNNNFSINYGLGLNYRASYNTYLKIGVKDINLMQSVDDTIIEVEYLEFPLEVKYVPFIKKINPYFMGGISYFMLQDATMNGQSNTDYNSTFSINFGIGAEYKIIKDLYFNIESNFNYQINPIIQNNNINPYIISLLTGIEYRFK